MTPDGLLNIVQQAIVVILIMVAPILGSGLAVGLTVSILQATTQIQEPTLAFVPKIVAVLLAVMFFGGWVFNHVVQFTIELWSEGLTMF
ncbi:MAG: flagellar biosynthesis protein FliQ [Dethiobacteria bacterium]|jgi:flagellar biosynthesis protein FliQ|nr:flagellar biosynthesis protein FliQ [Dethiobacteria bacterium]